MLSVDIFAVFAASIISIALATIWYAPQVCGRPWAQALGKKVNESDDEVFPVWTKRFALGVILQVVFFFGMAQLVALLSTPTTYPSLEYIIGFLAGGSALIVASFGVWEEKPLSYILINCMYTLLMVSVGGAILVYWPW